MNQQKWLKGEVGGELGGLGSWIVSKESVSIKEWSAVPFASDN